MSGPDYPANQAEAATADYWQSHNPGDPCPANCDLVFYRRKSEPNVALGPVAPELVRWDKLNECDTIAWHAVYSADQRARRIAKLQSRPSPADGNALEGEVG